MMTRFRRVGQGAMVMMCLGGCSGEEEPRDEEVVIVVGGEPDMPRDLATITQPDAAMGDQRDQATPEADGVMEATDDAVVHGVSAPREVVALGDGAASLVAEAVFMASQQGAGGAQLVVTGTLRQQGQTFLYTNSPADKLVIDWQEGPDTSFVVSAFDGDFSQDASHFLQNSHQLDFTVTRQDAVAMRVASVRTSTRVSGGMSGSVVIDGASFQVDLVLDETIDFDPGVGFVSYDSYEEVTGEISGPDVSITVNETHTFKLRSSDRGVATNAHTLNNSWQQGQDLYTASDMIVRSEIIDGWPYLSDFWLARGTVFKNQQPVATLRFDQPNTLWIALQLVVGDTPHELQRWELEQ